MRSDAGAKLSPGCGGGLKPGLISLHLGPATPDPEGARRPARALLQSSRELLVEELPRILQNACPSI
jgi:hypothetical protein